MKAPLSLFKLILLASILLITVTACSKPDAQDSHGKPISVSDYKGKWLVINYWANWCEPCLREMPDLNDLYKKNQKQIMVIGVNFDGLPNEQINSFAKKLNISFPLLKDFPIENYGIKSIATLPVTYLVSPNGKLVATLDGPQTKESLLKKIETIK